MLQNVRPALHHHQNTPFHPISALHEKMRLAIGPVIGRDSCSLPSDGKEGESLGTKVPKVEIVGVAEFALPQESQNSESTPKATDTCPRHSECSPAARRPSGQICILHGTCQIRGGFCETAINLHDNVDMQRSRM